MKPIIFFLLSIILLSLVTCNSTNLKKEIASIDLLDSIPYPMSDYITSLTFDTTRISMGHGDNWAITWADDGNQYSFFTDGKGFGRFHERVSISPVLIEGNPPNISGKDIPSESGTLPYLWGGKTSKKVSGILMVKKVLYAWIRNLTKEGTGSEMMYSVDYGRTWEYVGWNWPNIGYPSWLNAGQNYSAAQDEYAYFISSDGPSAYADYADLLMGRVHIDDILEKEKYVFFGGLNDEEQAIWGNYNNRKPIFTDKNGILRPDIVYNPGINRYFLLSATPYGNWGGHWENINPDRRSHFGIFEAPSPWGPWKTIYYENDWGKPENRFAPHIPSKWISSDGKSFYLLYSCIKVGPYQFNIQKCIMTLDETINQL